MKFFSLMLAAVTSLLVFCGCSENSLEYVPKSAEVVVYGNTEALLDSKIGELITESDTFNKELFKDIKKVLKLDDVDDLSGNFVVWWDNVTSNQIPSGAVVCFDNGNAEDIFNSIYKIAQDSYKVEKSKLKGCEMLVAKNSRERVEFAIVLLNDDTLQINFNEEPGQLSEDDGDNKIASKIDKNSVSAIGASPDFFETVCKEIKREAKFDVSGIGFGIVELFINSDEIEVKARLDIDDLEVK